MIINENNFTLISNKIFFITIILPPTTRNVEELKKKIEILNLEKGRN